MATHFDPAGDLVFDYRLAPGPAPHGSCGVAVARLAGVPDSVVRKAAAVVRVTTEEAALPPVCAPSEEAGGGVLSAEERDAALRLYFDPAVCRTRVGDQAWAESFFELWQETNNVVAGGG